MAVIGVSQIMFAKYNNNNGSVSYSGGGVMGKATSVDVNIDVTEDNNLFADNGIAETDRSFSGGTLTTGVDDFPQEVAKAVLGLVEEALGEVTGVTDEDVKVLRYDDDQVTPYLGVGFIIKRKKGGVTSWRAVMFTKVMYSVPNDSATTQGESIEWQTPELEATIMRDDSAKHLWKVEATFTTEAQAAAFLKNKLSITEAA